MCFFCLFVQDFVEITFHSWFEMHIAWKSWCKSKGKPIKCSYKMEFMKWKKKNYSFGFDAVDCSLPHCIHCTKWYLFVLALNPTESNSTKKTKANRSDGAFCACTMRRVWISSSSSSSSMATPTKVTSVRKQLLLLCGIVFSLLLLTSFRRAARNWALVRTHLNLI